MASDRKRPRDERAPVQQITLDAMRERLRGRERVELPIPAAELIREARGEL
jgi:hypothetical protein